jgi:hypothetical protein
MAFIDSAPPSPFILSRTLTEFCVAEHTPEKGFVPEMLACGRKEPVSGWNVGQPVGRDDERGVTMTQIAGDEDVEVR